MRKQGYSSSLHAATGAFVHVNAVDWALNADGLPFFVAHLPIDTDADYVAYVRERLREGARRNRNVGAVDVLFHVNAFTAAYLDVWIDELLAAFEDLNGETPVLGIPDCYLRADDPVVDLAVVVDALKPDWCEKRSSQEQPLLGGDCGQKEMPDGRCRRDGGELGSVVAR